MKDPSAKLQILIVEDDPIIGRLIRDYFEGRDYEFLHAENGQEGLKMTLEHIPDVLITDLMLPKMTGAGLIRTLRQLRDFATLPIVAITAGGDDLKQEAKDAGANIVLSKPLKRAQVIQTVEEFLALNPFVRQTEKLEK